MIVSNEDPKKMTTADIIGEMKNIRELAENVVRRYSALMAELRARGEKPPFTYHPVLSFWKEVHDEKLAPEAAVSLANRNTIKAILPLPIEKQVEVAKGIDIPVAVLKPDGEIASDDIPINRMDAKTLSRAFGPSGIRTVYEQAEIIKEEMKVRKPKRAIAIVDEGVVKIGSIKITPEELRGPLLALGYKLTLSRDH